MLDAQSVGRIRRKYHDIRMEMEERRRLSKDRCSRLWKVPLQPLLDELDLALHVCRFLPGTSKWNKIDHSRFMFITGTISSDGSGALVVCDKPIQSRARQEALRDGPSQEASECQDSLMSQRHPALPDGRGSDF